MNTVLFLGNCQALQSSKLQENIGAKASAVKEIMFWCTKKFRSYSRGKTKSNYVKKIEHVRITMRGVQRRPWRGISV